MYIRVQSGRRGAVLLPNEERRIVRSFRRPKRLDLRTIIFLAVFLLFLSCYIAPLHAAEPPLTDILSNLGFTNVAVASVETFPAGTYNITLYAEFAGYCDENELSYYQVGTSVFHVIFSGPEGGSGYISPPLTKTFNIGYEFGLSMLSPEHRYFTESARNPDTPEQHAKVYKNLDSPSMFLIGFENLFGGGDRDYNDMVFSLELQYYLDVVSPYDTPSGDGWYNNGTNAFASLTDDVVDHGNGTRRVFTHWSGDASGTNYAQSNPILVDGNKTAIANWKTQYLVTFAQMQMDADATDTVVTVNGSPKSFGDLPFSLWADEGSVVTYSYSDIVSSSVTGKRFFLDRIASPTSPFTVTGPETITGIYEVQYYLTVTSPYGTPGGTGWYNASDTAYATVTPLVVAGPAGVQYVFTGWSGDASGSSSPSDPITMDGPKTAVADWKTQYLVTFNYTGLDVNATGTVVTVNGSAKTFGGLPFTWWVDNGSWVEYSYGAIVSSFDPNQNFTLIDVAGPASPFQVGSPVTVTGNYQSQFRYYLAVSSDYGTPGGIGWYDNGTTAYATLDTGIIDHGNGTRRVFTHWSGDASGTNYSQSDPILVDGNKTAIANWKTQYYLTVTSPYATPGGEGWYDSGSTAYATISVNIVNHGNGTRRVFVNWGGDATGTGTTSDPITMSGPKTAIANWKTQYYLTVSSPYGTPGGVGWYDDGDTAYATLSTGVISYGNGSRQVFTNWSGDASGTNYAQSDPITMDGPKTTIANWLFEQTSPGPVGGVILTLNTPESPSLWVGLTSALTAIMILAAVLVGHKNRKMCTHKRV